jgi:hypothetical protein
VRYADLVGHDDPRPERPKVSMALQGGTPGRISRRWMSRAVMSLKIA